MPYRIKGTLKLPVTSQPAAGVDIEFISRRNYSPLLMDLSSVIKTSPTGAYDVTLEYGEYAVVLYWGCNQPSHIGKLFVFADTVTGLDLQTLLQQSDWQPATPEYIQQIQDWLAQSASAASQAVNSAAAAKASELAAEADRAEVASNKNIVVSAQADVTSKRNDVTTKAAQVATNTATVNEKTPLAVAAADTASQKAVAAAASDASARDAATRAENAALAMTGAILDGGQCDLSSGFYPPALTVSGKKYSTVWYVQVGGTVAGTKYDTGDKLQYTTANNGFYFRIDARDEVVSVNNEKGAVVLTAQKVGAAPDGFGLGNKGTVYNQQCGFFATEAPNGAGFQSTYNYNRRAQIFISTDGAVRSRFSMSNEVNDATTPWATHYTTLNKPKHTDVGADAAGTAASAVSDHAQKAAAHPISGVDGLATELAGKYSPANIVGAVSESEGVPTGAIIQRGSNANGEFVRFADGTQICKMYQETSTLDIGTASPNVIVERTWTFPMPFNSPACVSGSAVLGSGNLLIKYSHRIQGGHGVSSATYAIRTDASAPVAGYSVSICVTAIGRWY